MVEPEVIAGDPELHALFTEAAEASVKAYEELLEGLEKRFADVPNATLRRKQARQAARAVLPNATETRIVVTGNYRAWRHFIAMRATEHADVEIRALAVECLRQLQREVANVFADFEIASPGRRHRDRLQPVRHRGLSPRPSHALRGRTAGNERHSRRIGSDESAVRCIQGCRQQGCGHGPAGQAAPVEMRQDARDGVADTTIDTGAGPRPPPGRRAVDRDGTADDPHAGQHRPDPGR